ncbi:thiazole synthase [Prochlorococcus sp. MIT 1307]|uniref:thiazole synthase n=1 Tax=Prochlorococcus sp. MIT 1307 TaxID=3096219 RepID=UPI002A765F3A|nr:thiazole synthase [Prochlorococcus sp. MIT 1307]
MKKSKDLLTIGKKDFSSRLFTGTGKYSSVEVMKKSLLLSESQMVTVAVRRVQALAPGHEGLIQAIAWSKYWMLPNTAGCTNAEEAIRVARLGRELAKLSGQEDNNFIKLEVIPDQRHLLPDPFDTLQAAEQLIKEGFTVLPYINADPLLAKRLEEIGCATVMPLGSPIGSAQGIRNEANIGLIIENSKIPVIIDAGIGVPSEAAQALEMGAAAVLVNSAIAMANDPPAMAKAMAKAVQAGREAFLAGRIPQKSTAFASSPNSGLVTKSSNGK